MAENPIVAPPTPEALRTFFREQRTQPLADAASLLGWSRAQVKHRATTDEVLMRGGFVPWSHVASWLFETWTYAWVVLTLGPDAGALPVGLRAVPVIWIAPAWVIHGLNVQRQVELLPHRTVRPSTLSEYLTDFLARGIDPDTVQFLSSDREFMTAFDFPYGWADA
ncbi:MAG: hypothetical protein ABI779_19300 [Acidobacteriota bacterium]